MQMRERERGWWDSTSDVLSDMHGWWRDDDDADRCIKTFLIYILSISITLRLEYWW